MSAEIGRDADDICLSADVGCRAPLAVVARSKTSTHRALDAVATAALAGWCEQYSLI